MIAFTSHFKRRLHPRSLTHPNRSVASTEWGIHAGNRERCASSFQLRLQSKMARAPPPNRHRSPRPDQAPGFRSACIELPPRTVACIVPAPRPIPAIPPAFGRPTHDLMIRREGEEKRRPHERR
ncbi:uncharacterized protein [Physcomitrium patens]|uniref:uncharacterized protein n=1 Tax=Physcomitrium patens TaxID=3218 RepID=UPI003CCC9E3B